ncbi:MAG: IMS domain-containing protein [Xenococcaceae cyanobacterium]
MRIPLDYYRILGVPIQATDGQLSQAYHDRSLQLPRREYSDSAIAARKQLLDEAYEILSDPEQRAEYNAKFLEKTYQLESQGEGELPFESAGENGNSEVDSHTPWIEIRKEQFAGALLILQELGEYELVLRLGHPYLSSRQSSSSVPESPGKTQIREDIVLTMALAFLELGREQWQQGEHENAAASGQKGRDLLLQEDLFPSVQGEIRTDLYKLRPYRILELLAQSEDKVDERRKGLQLLKEMLQERNGIDGKGKDRSGLNIDEFLRFIQQIRIYLTAAEQQELFEAEARRPSAVATYLAVYVLLARGFAERKPALIVRAKEMLMRLGRRQDVHLEQAVCALLLGQTQEASLALERSQEHEPLAFIREHSQRSPDLLPGLCLYGERWLQTEVFSHFRDLASQKASLKEYFADKEVQAYLEQLPVETQPENKWSGVESERVKRVKAGGTLSHNSFQKSRKEGIRAPASARYQSSAKQEFVGTTAGRTATLTAPAELSSASGVSALIGSEGEIPEYSGKLGATGSSGQFTPVPSRRRRRSRKQVITKKINPKRPPKTRQSSLTLADRLSRAISVGSQEKTPGQKRLLLLLIAILLGLGSLGFLSKWLQSLRSSAPVLEGEQLLIQLNQPPVDIPGPDAQFIVLNGVLTKESAKQVLQNWLGAKSKAFGSNHQVDQLNMILAQPLLLTWRNRAEGLKRSNSYQQYQHRIQVRSVQTSEQNPNKARVEAEVRETAQYYQGGRLNRAKSYDDNLLVRYDLVRQNERWLIKDIQVLK